MEFLIDNFKHLTTSPENVGQLKKLVLRMAVQGKLTAKWREENPDVEPASVLLEKIKAEREILFREKKISKQFIDITNKRNETHNISLSWLSTKLGLLADIVRGGSPRPAGSNEFYNGKIPFLKVADITRNTEKYLNDYQYTIKEAGLKKTRFVKANTLMLTNSGATLGVPKICTFPTTFNDGIQAFLELSNFVNKEFLYYFLYSITDELRKITDGGGQPNLNTDISNNINILLPPLAEQQAIVSQVEKLFTQIDQLHALAQKRLNYRDKSTKALFSKINHTENDTELQETWQTLTADFHTLTQSKESIKQLRQSILQLAVQGKLTEKWRDENPDLEPASDLLEKIKEEKEKLIKDGKIKKQKPLSTISDEEKPFELPVNWEWERIGNYTYNLGQKKPDKIFTYIDVTSIDKSIGKITEPKIMSHKNAPSRARKIVENGSVIYSTVRPYLLNIAVIEQKYNEPIVSTAFAVMNLKMGSTYFIYFVLRSKYFIDFVESQMKGMAYPAISDSNFQKGIIPVPPIEEQKVIVSKVNQLMSWCDELEKKIEKRDAYQEKMMQAVVKQAFKTEKETVETE